jgi:hypothetical protein
MLIRMGTRLGSKTCLVSWVRTETLREGGVGRGLCESVYQIGCLGYMGSWGGKWNAVVRTEVAMRLCEWKGPQSDA